MGHDINPKSNYMELLCILFLLVFMGSCIQENRSLTDQKARLIAEDWIEACMEVDDFEDREHYLIKMVLEKYQFVLSDWETYLQDHPVFINTMRTLVLQYREEQVNEGIAVKESNVEKNEMQIPSVD
jgi:hypothetical protein